MTKHDNNHSSNFWFGFAMGSLSLTAAAYLIGTKKGRLQLQKLIEYADTVQDMPDELFRLIPTVKTLLTNEKNHDSTKPQETEKPMNILESLLEKVKLSSERKKDEKKYFFKGP